MVDQTSDKAIHTKRQIVDAALSPIPATVFDEGEVGWPENPPLASR